MAVDKLVDSAQLNADLTAVADAIREKGGTSESLDFPDGFVDAIDAIETDGGGDYKLLIDAPVKSTSIWNTLPVQNTISTDGVIEITFTDPTPSVDYGNIFSIGELNSLGAYGSAYVVHFYHGYYTDTDRDFIGIRFNRVGPDVAIDSTSPITIIITNGYVYVNGEQVFALPQNIKNLTSIAIGSREGNKRFQGTYSKISYR